MRASSKRYVGIATMIMSLNAQAYPGEGIVLDPATGNYTITYRGDPNSTELSQTIFVPSTSIAPTIRSNFRQGERNIIMYRYSVSNGTTAKQAIVGVVLDQIVNPIVGEIPKPDISATRSAFDAYFAAEAAAIASPVGWNGEIIRNHNDNLDRIAWMPSSDDLNINGIPAGLSLTGFGFNSMDLPGVGLSKMDGLGDVLGFPDEGPLESSAIFSGLERLRDNDFITCNAAVPTIAVPSPFDASTTLDRIRNHFLTWSSKQLIEPTFASQLDRYLVAAADAFRRNQFKAGKEHLEVIHKMLVKEHKHLDGDDESKENDEKVHLAIIRPIIDPLAARVLDFDLRYVLQLLELGHENGEKSEPENARR